MRYSIIDRANTRHGEDEATSLRRVIERARHAEELGFDRIWVAEHHGVPGIAGSAPTVLMASVAAATSRIRVGSAGVMLPAHQPLVVAEQAATLQLLHPGRIDLGIGRSLGFAAAVRRELRQDDAAAQRFGDDLASLLDHLAGRAPITARPRDELRTPVHILATGRGVRFAAEYGLGLVVGGPSLWHRESDVHGGVAEYLDAFGPSAWSAEPRVIVSASVAAAETADDARDLLLPEAWALVESRTTGEFGPLRSAEEVRAAAKTERQEALLEENVRQGIAGTPDEAAAGIAELLAFTRADEVMLGGGMFDVPGQLASDALLARTLGV